MNKDYYKIEFGEKEATFNRWSNLLTIDSVKGVRIEARVPSKWGRKKVRKFAEKLLSIEF